MEWEAVHIEPLKNLCNNSAEEFSLESGESVYAVFRKNDQKYLVYVANITDERCESIVDVQNLVTQDVISS